MFYFDNVKKKSIISQMNMTKPIYNRFINNTVKS